MGVGRAIIIFSLRSSVPATWTREYKDSSISSSSSLSTHLLLPLACVGELTLKRRSSAHDILWPRKASKWLCFKVPWSYGEYAFWWTIFCMFNVSLFALKGHLKSTGTKHTGTTPAHFQLCAVSFWLCLVSAFPLLFNCLYSSPPPPSMLLTWS